MSKFSLFDLKVKVGHMSNIGIFEEIKNSFDLDKARHEPECCEHINMLLFLKTQNVINVNAFNNILLRISEQVGTPTQLQQFIYPSDTLYIGFAEFEEMVGWYSEVRITQVDDEQIRADCQLLDNLGKYENSVKKDLKRIVRIWLYPDETYARAASEYFHNPQKKPDGGMIYHDVIASNKFRFM